jgi:hypothetical protein
MGKSQLSFHCDMRNLCKSCVLCRTPFLCCYHEFLLTQRECNFSKCFFAPICPHANIQSFKSKEAHLLEVLNQTAGGLFPKPATSLPSSFIPEIMPVGKDNREALMIAKDIGVPIIAVSLQNFFRGTRETFSLRKAKKYGLHRFFEFSGDIILTTDVNDRLCDLFVENPNYFRTIMEQLGPEYLTTFDTYTYSNIPACIARIKTLEATLSSYRLMDLNCKIVGLALGATPDQVYNHVELLTKLGCKIIAHPVYEFRKEADTDSIRWRIRLSRKLEAKVLLLSCSPGLTARRRVYSDYYSTWSWFSSVNSRDENAHRKRRNKLLRMITLAKKCSQQAHL